MSMLQKKIEEIEKKIPNHDQYIILMILVNFQAQYLMKG